MARPWFAAACLLALGCSASRFVVKPPTPGEPLDLPLHCTPGRGAAVVDTALALALAGLTVYAATRPVETSECGGTDFLGLCSASNGFNRGTRALAIGGLAAGAIVFGLSAGKGYGSSARCRELLDAERRCGAGDAGGCGTLGVPLPGSEHLPPPPPPPPLDGPAAASPRWNP